MRAWLSRLAGRAVLALLPMVAGTAGCNGVPSSVGGLDTSAAGITAFVRDKDSYGDWLAEPSPHPSSGPHSGLVRAFFNELLADSLAAGNRRHPVGSVVVKELLDFDDVTQFNGHAVMIKISDGDGGDSWVFFEGFAFDDYQGPYYGQGDPTCTGCHSQGTDYVLTSLPSAVMTQD